MSELLKCVQTENEHTIVLMQSEDEIIGVCMQDMLQVLSVADDREKVPELPGEWWHEIMHTYER